MTVLVLLWPTIVH